MTVLQPASTVTQIDRAARSAALTPVWRVLLLILTGFCTVSAIVGFIALGPGGAEGWPLEFLEGSPFNSYLWPATILLIVVGGTQSVAFVLLLLRRASASLWAAITGFAMVIWIIAEQLLFHVPDVSGEWIALPILQIVYSAIGLAELGCVLALLGLFNRTHTRAVIARRTTAPRKLSAQRR